MVARNWKKILIYFWCFFFLFLMLDTIFTQTGYLCIAYLCIALHSSDEHKSTDVWFTIFSTGSSGRRRTHQTPWRIRTHVHTSVNTKFQFTRPPRVHKRHGAPTAREWRQRWIFMHHNRLCPTGGGGCCPPSDSISHRCRVGVRNGG